MPDALLYAVEDQIATITWQMTTAPMNVLNDDSVPALEAALNRAYANPSLRGLIITSAKPEFVAGADLKMILRNADADPAQMLQISAGLNRLMRTLETWGKPTVAAINGTALGGGYELCLGCHHRIALNNTKTVIGLPEVTVGLLPGGGGTQRLPRMLGLQTALPFLLEGKKVGVKEALTLGLVDAVADTPDALLAQARAWIAANPHPVKPWDEVNAETGRITSRADFVPPGGNAQSTTGKPVFDAARALILDKTKGNYPAPLAILDCLAEGLAVNIDDALDIESAYFVQVARSKVAQNLIRTMFLGLNEANKGASRPKAEPPTEVKKLGLLGAGMMGAGIAYVSALAGMEVVLKDVTTDAAERGKDYARKLLQKNVERGQTNPATAETVLNRIKTTADIAHLAGCDLIIEAVFENKTLKATVTREAEPMLATGGIFASNTSTLPITGLAEASANPLNFIGIHFFSPVDKMQLIEIIVGQQTSDHALAVAMDYVRKIRKTPIVVNDSRGFYTSRVFSTYTAEGMELLRDGVDPALIENAGRLAGMPVGPLAVTDEIALDLAHKIAGESIRDGALAETDTAFQVSKQMVELGRLGKKAKAGFYDYPADAPKRLWPGLTELFPLAANQPTVGEVKTRLLYRQAIETLRCLTENVVRSPLDADLGSILGWGFPTYTGGTASFVDFVGRDHFVNECRRLADLYGPRFQI